MQIGRKIYYGKSNGVVIWDKGEMQGDIVLTTFEEDKSAMPTLALISEDEIGVLQLECGDYCEEFKTCKGYIINQKNQRLEFAY